MKRKVTGIISLGELIRVGDENCYRAMKHNHWKYLLLQITHLLGLQSGVLLGFTSSICT